MSIHEISGQRYPGLYEAPNLGYICSPDNPQRLLEMQKPIIKPLRIHLISADILGDREEINPEFVRRFDLVDKNIGDPRKELPPNSGYAILYIDPDSVSNKFPRVEMTSLGGYGFDVNIVVEKKEPQDLRELPYPSRNFDGNMVLRSNEFLDPKIKPVSTTIIIGLDKKHNMAYVPVVMFDPRDKEKHLSEQTAHLAYIFVPLDSIQNAFDSDGKLLTIHEAKAAELALTPEQQGLADGIRGRSDQNPSLALKEIRKYLETRSAEGMSSTTGKTCRKATLRPHQNPTPVEIEFGQETVTVTLGSLDLDRLKDLCTAPGQSKVNLSSLMVCFSATGRQGQLVLRIGEEKGKIVLSPSVLALHPTLLEYGPLEEIIGSLGWNPSPQLYGTLRNSYLRRNNLDPGSYAETALIAPIIKIWNLFLTNNIQSALRDGLKHDFEALAYLIDNLKPYNPSRSEIETVTMPKQRRQFNTRRESPTLYDHYNKPHDTHPYTKPPTSYDGYDPQSGRFTPPRRLIDAQVKIPGYQPSETKQQRLKRQQAEKSQKKKKKK